MQNDSWQVARRFAVRLLIVALPALASFGEAARTGPADFSSSTCTPASATVYPLDTIDFDVEVVNTGEPPFNWVEVDVTIPASAMFASAGPGWKFDANDRRIRWQAPMAEARRKLRFSLLAMAETEGNTISPGVTIRHGAEAQYLWPKVEVDTRPIPTAFKIGGFGVTPAGVVVFGFLGILAATMLVAMIVVRAMAPDAERLPLSRVPLLVSGIWVVGLCLGFLLYFAWLASQDRRMQTEWKESRCTVVDSLATYTESSSSSGRTDGTIRKRTGTWRPVFALRYATPSGEVLSSGYRSASALDIGGGTRATDAAMAAMKPGSVHPCWYDPADVKQVVLSRKAGGAYFFALIPFLVMFLGIAMVRHGIRSLGRRAG